MLEYKFERSVKSVISMQRLECTVIALQLPRLLMRLPQNITHSSEMLKLSKSI